MMERTISQRVALLKDYRAIQSLRGADWENFIKDLNTAKSFKDLSKDAKKIIRKAEKQKAKLRGSFESV